MNHDHEVVRCGNCHVLIRSCKCPYVVSEITYDTCHNCKVEAAAHEAIDVIAECTEDDVDFGVAFIIVTREGDYVASKYEAGVTQFHYTTNPLLAAMYTTLDQALRDVELYTQDPEFTTRHWGVRELLGTVLPFHKLS